MSTRIYWLALFTPATWREFLENGARISGFREARWKTLQNVKKGDYLLCYLTGLSRWVGLLEVASEPFKDNSPIWKDEQFPCRVRVKDLATLTPETGIPVTDFRDQLTVFQKATVDSPLAWTAHFRSSPTRWKNSDGEIISSAILDAQKNPVARPIDPAKVKYLRRGSRGQARRGLPNYDV